MSESDAQIGAGDRQELRENMERIAKMFATIRFSDIKEYSFYQDWIQRTIESDVGEDLIYIAIFAQHTEGEGEGQPPLRVEDIFQAHQAGYFA